MLKSFKTEINPTEEQKVKIRKTIGTCRYIYNFYLAHNKELYDKGEKFMSGKSFSVWLNNEYLPQNPDKLWIKEVSSKSVKRSIENGCIAFTRFFKHQSAFPNFKKKGKSDVPMIAAQENAKLAVPSNPQDWLADRKARLTMVTNFGSLTVRRKISSATSMMPAITAKYAV